MLENFFPKGCAYSSMMMLRVTIHAVVLYLLLINYKVNGKRLSEKDRLEIEKQLKILRKPAEKTIHTDDGEIYDCINFYKQPAFDHPLLKNHNFYPQMRPNFTPKMIQSVTFSTDIKTLKLGFKDGGCPEGTVPIRRITRDDLIRIKYFTEEYASRLKLNGNQPNNTTHVAIVRTSSIPYSKKTYKGVGGIISVYNLPVKNSQYTAATITLQNGLDIIQVGWMVNPILYKENHTHGFAYLNAGKSHCFNTLCPGFISVRADIPIDSAFQGPLTIRGRKTRKVCHWFIYQDIYSGNWWLGVGENSTLIGFWPKKIFTSLAEHGTFVACGGQVYSPPGEPDPPMGSGFRPKINPRYDAYCKDFIIVNGEHEIEPAMDMEEYSDYDIYKVKDMGIVKGFGHLLLFGGPKKP